MSNTYEGTKVTEGITSNDDGSIGSLNKNTQGTEGAYGSTVEIISPVEVFEAVLREPNIERPTYLTHDDWFLMGGVKSKPGLYYHGIDKTDSDNPVNIWICSPIHADALTSNEHGADWGLLLRFINPNGTWREWAMPSSMLKGYGEDMRGELLSLGVRISPDGNKPLHRWLASQEPKSRIIAAMRTGWHESQQGIAFVLPRIAS